MDIDSGADDFFDRDLLDLDDCPLTLPIVSNKTAPKFDMSQKFKQL